MESSAAATTSPAPDYNPASPATTTASVTTNCLPMAVQPMILFPKRRRKRRRNEAEEEGGGGEQDLRRRKNGNWGGQPPERDLERGSGDSSPLPVRRNPQLIAWPPVPPAADRRRPSPQPAAAASPSAASGSNRGRRRQRSSRSPGQPHPSSSGTTPAGGVLQNISPRHLKLTPPHFPILAGARQLLFHHHSPSGSAATAVYRRVPEEGEEEEEEQRQQRKQGTSSAEQKTSGRPQRRVPTPRRIRPQAHHHSLPSTSSAYSGRPVSQACPLNLGSEEHRMRPYRLDVVLQMPELSAEELERHSWNSEDRSVNIYVKEEDRLTLHRHPVAQSTDSIRGKMGYTRGFHVWQLVWPTNQRGTHAVVGVVTKDAALHAAGYMSLVGLDTDGFGWNIVENKCYHDCRNTKGWTYPAEQPFEAPDKLFCILDMDEGQLAFATESTYLGVAFRGLKGKRLYPAISAVWGHCEVTLKYLGGLDPEPRQLMDICRRAIRMQLGKSKIDRIGELNLPPGLRQYLLYK